MRRKVKLTKQIFKLRDGKHFTKKSRKKKDCNYKKLGIVNNI